MATTFAKKLARKAEDEFNNYHIYDETAPIMAARIKTYWTDIGLSFPGVGVPWSAVFVSSRVKAAGATKTEFKFAAAHSVFVYQAAKNAAANVGVFRAFAPTSYAPKIGDIIQNNRSGNTFTFSYAKSHENYVSHSAIVVEEGVDGSGRYVRTIGGNESDKVGERIVRVTSSGLIKQPASALNYYISVIQNLK